MMGLFLTNSMAQYQIQITECNHFTIYEYVSIPLINLQWKLTFHECRKIFAPIFDL